MSRRIDKERKEGRRSQGRQDTMTHRRTTGMCRHAKNGGIAPNKRHDNAVIFFTFPQTLVRNWHPSSLPAPSPSFADYANLISPSTRSQWGGGGAERGRKERERVRHATIRRIAQSQSHTPRHASLSPTRAVISQPDLILSVTRLLPVLESLGALLSRQGSTIRCYDRNIRL